uniref:hypothetical protein n=1 Tax=Salmonella sp. SAL4447 TaxID=3159902 RepID=UPI00397C62FF
YRSQPIASTHATWYPYNSFTEVTDAGTAIVEAEVISVAKGPDEIVSLAGSVEPSGQDVIPHQDARLRVINSVEGSIPAGSEITVRHVY